MSWAEKVTLVMLALGALVVLTVWLLLTLASRGRHSDKQIP